MPTTFPAPASARIAAFSAEATVLSEVASRLTAAALRRPSPCPPWNVGGLLSHVIVAIGRVDQAIEDGPEARGDLVTAAGYYRPDARFSAEVNADRIDVATALASRLDSPAAISQALTTAAAQALELLKTVPPDRLVRTRHGDPMLLTEFTVTRVVELGVHGLDVAAGLGTRPWLTREAAGVIEELLMPGGTADSLRAELGCDQAGLIALLTGRQAMSARESAVLYERGLTKLALG